MLNIKWGNKAAKLSINFLILAYSKENTEKTQKMIISLHLPKMKAKKYKSFSGLVYSTNPDAIKPEAQEEEQTLPPKEQILKVLLNTKRRKGKVVTLITGFRGNDADLRDLGKQLKTKCGTGGSVKEGDILIQGNYKEAICRWLKEADYGLK